MMQMGLDQAQIGRSSSKHVENGRVLRVDLPSVVMSLPRVPRSS